MSVNSKKYASIFSTSIYHLSLYWLGIVLILIGWHLIAIRLGSFLMPTPLNVFIRVKEILTNYANSDIGFSLYRISISLAISIVLGIGLGIIAGLSKALSLILRPFITLLLGVPPIIWIVLAVFWFDVSDTSVVFTIVLVILPLCFAATMHGIYSIDNNLSEMMYCFQLPLATRLKYLYIPHLAQCLLPALTIAVSTGIKVSIMAELLSANSGIGYKIAEARIAMDTVDVFAYVVITLLIIYLVEYVLFGILAKYILPKQLS